MTGVWHTYLWRYSPLSARSVLHWIVSVQPRLDFCAVYVTLGVRLDVMFGWNRYAAGSAQWTQRLMQLLLVGDCDALQLFAADPFAPDQSQSQSQSHSNNHKKSDDDMSASNSASNSASDSASNSASASTTPLSLAARTLPCHMRLRLIPVHFTAPSSQLSAAQPSPHHNHHHHHSYFTPAPSISDQFVCHATLNDSAQVWSVSAVPDYTDHFTPMMWMMM